MNHIRIDTKEMTNHHWTNTLHGFTHAGFIRSLISFQCKTQCLNIMCYYHKLLHSAHKLREFKPQICKCSTWKIMVTFLNRWIKMFKGIYILGNTFIYLLVENHMTRLVPLITVICQHLVSLTFATKTKKIPWLHPKLTKSTFQHPRSLPHKHLV